MKTSENALIEILCMVSIYRKHHLYDFAVRMLHEFIDVYERFSPVDNRQLALAQYNLAEVYSDQGNFILSKELYKHAAQLWEQLPQKDLATPSWYASALLSLQKETDRLMLESHAIKLHQETA